MKQKIKEKKIKAWAVVSTNPYTRGDMITSGSLDKFGHGRYFIFPFSYGKKRLQEKYNSWLVLPITISIPVLERIKNNIYEF